MPRFLKVNATVLPGDSGAKHTRSKLRASCPRSRKETLKNSPLSLPGVLSIVELRKSSLLCR